MGGATAVVFQLVASVLKNDRMGVVVVSSFEAPRAHFCLDDNPKKMRVVACRHIWNLGEVDEAHG
jgi:hypothetical protein